MPKFRTRLIIELSVLLFFTVFHVVSYLNFSRAKNTEKIKPPPIFITLEQPKPKPKPVPVEPKKIEPPKKIEAPKPKPVTPPKPPKPVQPPKVLKKPPKPPTTKPKPVMEEKPQRIVEKPKMQQESPIKVHAEEVVEKEVAEKPQQLSEPEVKKTEPKVAEKVVEAPPAPEPEPPHEPEIEQAGYEGSSTASYYPPEAKEQGIEGLVKVKVQVLEDGCMGNATIAKSSGSDILDNAAIENINKCGFHPKKVDGVPVKSTVIVPVRFRLEN